MNILLLYAKDEGEVFNRKSAIGSYINCLGHLLHDQENRVYLNGIILDKSPSDIVGNNRISSSKKGVLNNVLPKRVKLLIKEILNLKRLKKISNRLSQQKNNYDLIIEFYTIYSNIGLNLAKQHKCKLITVYDGPIIEEYSFFNGLKPILLNLANLRERNSLKSSDSIVVYSNPMKDFVERLGGERCLIHIHQNVDFTRFDKLDEVKEFHNSPIKMCFIGSFLKWHQVDMLVNAFASIYVEIPAIELYLVGDGMERASIADQVAQLPLNIQEKIYFTGFLDGEALFNLKKEMHIGIMPGSNWYGAPNKIFEYGAMKLAVVAPNTPTIIDLFSPNEVKLFDWKDQEALASALLELSRSEKLLKNYSKELSLKVLKKYNPEITTSFYMNLIS